MRSLPSEHVKGLKGIVFKPARELGIFGIPIHQGCKGGFYPEFYTIVIFDLVDRKTAEHVLYHEIGHYYYHCKMDSYTKKEWTAIYNANRKPVSSYGSKNWVEDFSEAYAYFICQPDKLMANNWRKYIFLKSRVFNT